MSNQYQTKQMAGMAINPDGSLNTKKLQKELIQGLEDDRNYQRTDDMKKRAIHVAGTYDEFRNMVLCANQQPVTRKELESLSKPSKGWQNSRTQSGLPGTSSARAKKNTGQGEIKASKKLEVPKNSVEFERDWRRKCNTDLKKIKYLRLVGPRRLAALFAGDLDAALLGQLLGALGRALALDGPPPDDPAAAAPAAGPAAGGKAGAPAGGEEGAAAAAGGKGGGAPPGGEGGGAGGRRRRAAAAAVGAGEYLAFLGALGATGRFDLNLHFLSTDEVEGLRSSLEKISSKTNHCRGTCHGDDEFFNEFENTLLLEQEQKRDANQVNGGEQENNNQQIQEACCSTTTCPCRKAIQDIVSKYNAVIPK